MKKNTSKAIEKQKTTIIVPYEQKQVAELLLKGLKPYEIAEQLALKIEAVIEIIDDLYLTWEKESKDFIHKIKLRDLQRTEVALDALYEKVKEGNWGAISTMMTVLKRRAEMLGYDADKNSKNEATVETIAVFKMSLDDI